MFMSSLSPAANLILLHSERLNSVKFLAVLSATGHPCSFVPEYDGCGVVF